ncbi:MAG: CoB--CoM heterodisulfide reductase iron-sulfur subunit D [Methanobacterium sp. PtaU1.Bin242]|nr:MAG: CoB--CoM heterodisulfide reductase iron-sulfur subunit D [Methanobacterium sp. PtaU1.Bin242]
MIEVKVFRYHPQKDEKSHLETYKITKTDKMKVLDALNCINEEYNAHISYRSSCRAGQCGSCAVKVNGQTVLACKAEIEEGDIIEPLDFDVIKDLVVDRSLIDSQVKEMGLFIDECDSFTCPAIMKPSEYENSKKLRSCIECLSCLSVCPALKDTDEFAGPYFMRYLGKFAMDPRDCGERARTSFDEGIYCCTSCAKCVEVCPKEINTFGGAIEKLRELSCQEGIGPLPPHKSVKELIEKTGRSVEPLGEGNMGEGFIKSLPQKFKGKKPKIAFFTGCMIDYRLPDVGMALIDVLENLGIEIAVPSDQVCCGSPMIRTGQTDILEELVRKNKEVFQDYDAIITVCAGCGATLKNDYPNYGAELNVIEISQFLTDKLNIEDMKPLNLKVTYHDPCHLARGQGIREEPREILKELPGLEFVEMKEPDRCCGSGGGVRSGKPELASKIGKRKADMVKELDVDAVVTICPFCEYHISDSLQKEEMDTTVLNLLKLLQMAYSQ